MNSHNQYPKQTINHESLRNDFLERKGVKLTRRGKIVLGSAALIATGATLFGGAKAVEAGVNAIQNHTAVSTETHSDGATKVGFTFSKEVSNGSTVIDTIREIANVHSLNVNPTELGQEASYNQSSEQGSGYVAQPGDEVIVNTDTNNEVTSVEIVTNQERNAEADD